MGHTVSQESGFPSSFDYYSIGSEVTAKAMIPEPAGMTTAAHSARVNQHQEPGDTQPVGVPGTTWSRSADDLVYRTQGGHALIFGHSPGQETMRMQSKHGATVELDAEGRIKMVSVSGMHVSIGGDNQIVLTGDFHIVTNGAFKVKCSDVFFDCANFNVFAKGNLIQHVGGTFNQAVNGDSHVTTQGDHAHTVGGSVRNSTAGDYKNNVSGDMTYSGAATATFSSVGDFSMGTKAKMSASSESDMSLSTKTNMSQIASGNTSHASGGSHSVQSQSSMNIGSQDSITVSSKSTSSVTGGSSVKFATNGNMELKASQLNGVKDTDGNQSVQGVGNASHSDPTQPNTAVANTTVTVPTSKQMLDEVGDASATEGAIDRIMTRTDLEQIYEVEDGGTIPDKVKQRAIQKGILDSNYQPPTTTDSPAVASYGGDLGDTFNVG